MVEAHGTLCATTPSQSADLRQVRSTNKSMSTNLGGVVVVEPSQGTVTGLPCDQVKSRDIPFLQSGHRVQAVTYA